MKIPLHLNLDLKRRDTDGTYEYYYTEPVIDGYEGELRNISLKAPNVAQGNIGEIGIYRMKQYWPLEYSHTINDDGGIAIQGNIPIYGGERVYAKITGTAVDADVELNAIGYSWAALPEKTEPPESP